MSDLDLSARSGLPDHLRILADRYPRASWEGHTNFDDLTRFWLDRHLMFRDLHGRLVDAAQTHLDKGSDPRDFAMRLHRFGGMLINQLHGHHQIEDAHYFPQLMAKDDRLAAAFDLLDADHHALHDGLERLTTTTNAALQALVGGGSDPRPTAQFLSEIDQFGKLLIRHLEDEEEIVVPVILEHGGGDLV